MGPRKQKNRRKSAHTNPLMADFQEDSKTIIFCDGKGLLLLSLGKSINFPSFEKELNPSPPRIRIKFPSSGGVAVED